MVKSKDFYHVILKSLVSISMLQYFLIGVPIALIVSPLGLLAGRKLFRLSELKIWHIWLALIGVPVIAYFTYYFEWLGIEGFAILGVLMLLIFHFILKIFVRRITFTDSFGVFLVLFFSVFVLIFLSIPFWNQIFFLK